MLNHFHHRGFAPSALEIHELKFGFGGACESRVLAGVFCMVPDLASRPTRSTILIDFSVPGYLALRLTQYIPDASGSRNNFMFKQTNQHQ